MAIQPPPVPPDSRKGVRPLPATVQPPPVAAAAPAPAPAEISPENVPESHVPEASFWQHPFVQQVLPFLTSLVLHVSLIVLGYLSLKAYKETLAAMAATGPEEKEQVVKEQVTPTESNYSELLDYPQTNLKGFPGLGSDPTRRAEQNKFPEVSPDSKGTAERPGTNLIPRLGGGDGGGADTSGVIGIGGPGGLRPGGGVMRGGAGEGDGSGKNVAPWGIPGGGGGTPSARFVGSRAVANRIAYVCDASGSMMTMFDDLRQQITISVGNLTPVQSFDVIFFQDQGCWALDKTALVPANPENKRKAEKFLADVTARSETNPIPALELAKSLKPELIYLLTDGDFSGPGNDAVIRFCKENFADGKTKINTIAFVSKEYKDNPQDLEFVKALQAIARNSGGNFKHVGEVEMSAR